MDLPMNTQTGSSRQRIAILGGGMGALSAALALTAEKDWQTRYEITVYQLGFRLGGKGASGRNARYHDRIEEHGLHIWLGFYDNAFSLLRRCYEELDRKPGTPLARIEDAFAPHDYVGVAAGGTSHEKRFWLLDFPRNDKIPGTPDDPHTLGDFAKFAAAIIERHQKKSLLRPQTPGETTQSPSKHRSPLLRNAARALKQRVSNALLQTMDLDSTKNDWLQRTLLRNVAPPDADAEEFENLVMLGDFFSTVARGVVEDGVLLFGLDVLDAWDLRAWLERHGASAATVNAPFIKAWYDLAFAYENGDPARPNFAAGAALRAILKTSLTYKGAVFWKMQAGMGDVVFAPIYEVLRRRGVRFEFFHRVDAVEAEPMNTPGKNGAHCRITRLRMTRQATVRGEIYEPLVNIDGLPCWPSEPLYDQLNEGPEIRAKGAHFEDFWTSWPGVGEVILERDRDFDTVIFGISLGAVPYLCPTILAANPAWQMMVDRVRTVATQAAQLWFHHDLEKLGWKGSSPIVDAYDDPFNTWADMSFLLHRERWPKAHTPRSLAYLVGPFHEPSPPPGPEVPGFEATQRAVVCAQVRHWLGVSAAGLWPNASHVLPGFDWSTLYAADGIEGANRLSEQYLRVNVAPSERYVQSLAGSTQYRLFVESAGVDGLYPVGDWVNTGINSGDIEAATISGLQAARAVTGKSRPIFHEGDGWARHCIDRGVMPFRNAS